MVHYMDKKVGDVVSMIKSKGIADNTIIIYLGDNGTPNGITSLFNGMSINGGKGTTTVYGTHVPLIVYCLAKYTAGVVNNLVDLTDFMPTLAQMAGLSPQGVDGLSFYPALSNKTAAGRSWIFCHWQPQKTSVVHRWAQTAVYKLYDTTQRNKYFNIVRH